MLIYLYKKKTLRFETSGICFNIETYSIYIWNNFEKKIIAFDNFDIDIDIYIYMYILEKIEEIIDW